LKSRTVGSIFQLGSVNPDLVRGLSESLAGRVGVLELTPFLLGEVGKARPARGADALWLRGGFPDAYLARTGAQWADWQEAYLRTFIERDVTRAAGTRMSPIGMHRLVAMLAHVHGGLLNASELGRSLGLNYHTIQGLLDLLEGHFLIRRLPPYHANLGKRLVKAPKLYLRDSGLRHHLLGIASEDDLLRSPARGASFEGFVVEQTIAAEQLRPGGSGSRFFFYRTHAGAEIDLIVDRGQTRTGYEIKCSASCSPADWANLRAGIEQGVIHRGCVVYQGARAFEVDDRISVRPVARALTGRAGPA
jgi:predicted AAA+ superfamily ATPase